MDGTSMASPAAWGALAAILSTAPDYQNLPRDVSHYLICHFCFIAVRQYGAQCPSYLGLWGI